VITKSDAVRFRVLSRSQVDAPRAFTPNKTNIAWLKLFLNDTAEDCNVRIGGRLAELLTFVHANAPALFDPQAMADRLAGIFHCELQVSGVTGSAPIN
jgi:hypothetical protein